MPRWILENLGIVIFVVIFITQILRGAARSKKAAAEHTATKDDAAEQRRIREVQEQIRRQIAARRGQAPAPAAPPPLRGESAPVPQPSPQTTQLPELFGGPLGRMLEELQKRAQPPPAAPAPPAPRPAMTEAHTLAEVSRQEELAEQMRVLEEDRLLARRKAAHLAADQRELAESEGGLRTAARAQLNADLADPSSLRRALVLREVLGPPVAMR